jgi:threonine/homoserine/homoserine lactone efflux protein
MNLEFLLAATLIELTPGPNMAWLAMLGASRGRTPALASVAGIALGLAIAGAVAAVGVAAFLESEPWLFTALRIAGTLYLLYLAFDAWRSSTKEAADHLDQPIARFFGQGLVSNIVNPKAYLFYATILPQYIDPKTSLAPQFWALTASYVAIATVIHAAIAIFSGTFNVYLSKQSLRARIGRIFAGLLVVVAAWFYISAGRTG